MKIALLTLLAALALAATAQAATTRIDDGKRETRALADRGRLDIIKASSSRFGGDLRFRVTMRRAVRPSSDAEQPRVLINTRGGNRSDAEFVVLGNDLFDVRGQAKRIAPVQVGARGRSWSLRFDIDAIRNLNRFGWAALTKVGRTEDVAPGNRYAEGRI